MSTALTEEQARGYMHKLLAAMVQGGGFDLFIAADFALSMKSHGSMGPMSAKKLSADVTRMLAQSMMNERQPAEFPRRWSATLPSRCPAFRAFVSTSACSSRR